MSTSRSNKPDQSRQQHWGLAIFVLAIQLPAVFVNLMNPALSPTLRIMWLGIFTLIVMGVAGFALYGIYRARWPNRIVRALSRHEPD